MDATQTAERLERGDVVHYPSCPFPLPDGDDLAFLLRQRLALRGPKNIGYDPHADKVSGYQGGAEEGRRLHAILSRFSETTTAWLRGALPRYAEAWKLDRVSYRPEEEATRRLRLTARNDLLHVDAFPSRPTNGARILRVFANVNPTEPRVWVTSDPFARLLEKYGGEAGLPVGARWTVARLTDRALRLFRPGRPPRSPYDDFMLRLHNFLKANDDFQQNGPRRQWSFGPGSAWLAITDTCSHAVLRGRFALEHSYFLEPSTLALPDEAPAALLARACGTAVLNGAA